MVKNSLAELLIQHRAIEFGNFTLASGTKSPYYVDIKTAMTRPALLSPVAEKIAASHDFDVVAGVAVGGVPLCVAVSLAKKKPFAIVRAAEKDHGKKSLIIGDVKDKDVLLVEDVTTSGGSALYGVRTLRNAGAHIDRVVTVVDREQGAEATLASQGVRVIPLVKLSELLHE